MLRLWEELNRVENLFLELLDDPKKKDVLLYLICYCQLVRRDGEYEVELPKLINCAEKPYKYISGNWQDVLLELGVLYLKDKKGKVYTGKEILLVKNPEGFKVGILPDYREDFYKFYTKLLKYWSVLNSRRTLGSNTTPDYYTPLLVHTFNEKLFKEAQYFSEILAMRFPKEKNLFLSVKLVSEFYREYAKTGRVKADNLNDAINFLSDTPDVFYSVNVKKFKKDIKKFLENLNKGEFYYITIEFASENRGKKRSILSKLWNFIKSLGGKRWNSRSSGMDYYSFIEHLLKKHRRQMMRSLESSTPRLQGT
ncbi:hypothetical protein [Aquifex aeolicus]|uniref:Uncharacterized protein aq_1909 n=1 Tax=Aquifex aeolicus (strain VF5) TaxID=224324 RepID=Y1909_AQUAE|nr:hypothetical protein [Aquifex aeolicus]O67744.1 RecName: Full=Uncharacterized protein aq_1909 [Aquifex aeolicus VF5]AAC07704.1 putative protein [Aquifex aeolicus VF5]